MYEFLYRAWLQLVCKIRGETEIANGVVYFARNSNPHMIKVLLDSTGVDVNTKPSRGASALTWAVLENSSKTASALLRAGAKATEDVLFAAIDNGTEHKHGGHHVLGLLLAAGVSLDSDESAEVSLAYAFAIGNYTAAALLLAAGVPSEIPLLYNVVDPSEIDTALVCALAKHRNIAAKELELVGFGEIRDRLLEICVGLHDANLPTPILTLIVEFACEPFASRLPYHYLWDSVVAIRHFRARRHAPAPQHGDLLVKCRRTQDQVLAREKAALEEKNERAIEMENREDLVGAMPLLREILEVRRAAFGERFTATLVTKFNLAWALFSTGCLEEAKALYLDVLEPDNVPALYADNTRALVLSRARTCLDLVLAEISKRH